MKNIHNSEGTPNYLSRVEDLLVLMIYASKSNALVKIDPFHNLVVAMISR